MWIKQMKSCPPLLSIIMISDLLLSGCKVAETLQWTQDELWLSRNVGVIHLPDRKTMEALQTGADRVAMLWYQGCLEDALEESRRVEAKHGAYDMLYYQRSRIMEEMDRVDEAEREGLKIIPLYAGGYAYMSLFYERYGKWQEADRMLEDALKDPEVASRPKFKARVHWIKVRRLVERQDFDAAWMECESALRSDAAGKLPPEAKQVVREVLDNPSTGAGPDFRAALHWVKARIFFEAGDLSAMQAECDIALAPDSSLPPDLKKAVEDFRRFR
ncbi:MAG: hypothetical protein IJS32_00405 [Kiritimatiellae bacterium]|nr:hypothetical protein [Kiritimatiellia bacterium]